MRKRVLQVMNYGSAYKGNFIRSIEALETEISKDCGKIVYVLPRRAKKRDWTVKMKEEGHSVFFLNDRIFADTILLKRLIKEFDINIIHSHFMTYKTYIPIRLARISQRIIPHIVHAHSQAKRGEILLIDFLRKKIIDEKVFICVSDAVKEQFEKRGHKCTTVKNSIDFSRLNTCAHLDRSDYQNNPDDKLLLMLGYDFKIKGIDTVIRSLQKYDKDHNIVLLLCVANHIEKARKQITKLCGGIPEWIKLLPPRDDIASYYNICDLFVSASRNEGFNYSLVEAAYCLKPIAATDIPGQNELEIPFTFIFEKNNEEQFFSVAKKSLNISDEQRLYNTNIAKEYVIEQFSLHKWTKRVAEIYSKYL